MAWKKYLKRALLGLGALVVAAGAFGAHEWYADKPFFVNNFYNRAFLKYVLESPQTLTTMGLLEQVGITGHNAKWDNDSLAGQDKQLDYLDDIYASMNLYPDDELDENELITKKVVMELLGDPVQQRKYRFYDYPVNQLFGLQNNVPRFLDSYQRVENARDAGYYLKRLEGIPTKFAQNMEGLKVREEMGIIPPTFVIDKVIEEMNNFVATLPEENILYVSFKDKLEKTDMAADAQAKFLADAAKDIQERVYPAYQSYIAYFTALRTKSTTDAGVWKFPDGEAFYNYMLRSNTTTDMTANEIHALGLSEVDRIEKQMTEIFKEQGYDTSVGFTALINGLAKEDRFYYPDTDEGRAQILKDYEGILTEVNDGLGDAFNIRPKAKLEVKRVPEFSEKTAPGAYYNGPSMDGKRPGIFYANLYDVKATPKYSMKTLAYHEGIPGHHFQIAIQNELKDVPMLRTQAGFTAYAEGWALYAERLAWELGFESDPYDNLGRLQAELFRAVRLVVDTGIHAKRWTREQAIQYMLDNTGMAESDVVAEIERYIVMPGQATAYKVGQLEILRLREQAKAELGDKFKLADFHDVVLKNGSVPLVVLRELVEKYIADKKAS
jgi:uncharacterized protein (DUF885 family)